MSGRGEGLALERQSSIDIPQHGSGSPRRGWLAPLRAGLPQMPQEAPSGDGSTDEV